MGNLDKDDDNDDDTGGDEVGATADMDGSEEVIRHEGAQVGVLWTRPGLKIEYCKVTVFKRDHISLALSSSRSN